MADIHLTNGDDVYVQAEADRNKGDNIYGDDGNDVIRLYSGTAVGGKGNDRFEFIPIANEPWRQLGVAYWTSPKGVFVNLEEGYADDGFGGRDTLIGVRVLHGSGNDDTFIGDAKDNYFYPNGGHDIIDGRGGYDGLQVREIPQTADGSGKWLPALMSQLDIAVAPDGRSATISVKVYPKFKYELSNIEYFQLMNDDSKYLLADFIRPEDMAQQAIAAGSNLRWNANSALGTGVTLSYSFVTAAPAEGVGAPGFRAFSASEQQAVRDILARTAAMAGLNFNEVAEAGASVGQLRFGVSTQAATKGVSWLPNQTGAGDLAGDVWMDVESMVGLTPGSEGYMALLHEIGHALGLRHPRNVDAGDAWPMQLREQDDRTALTVMSETLSADGLFRSEWGALDVLALRYLYGSRSLNTGDSRYVLGVAESNAQTTLVDEGGNDTLDASSSPIGVSLDLMPGHLSSAGLSVAGVAAVDNLAIAASSRIENAVGSAFDDVLMGNDADNWLAGGLGNDWIDGGPGIDTAVFSGRRADYDLSTSFGKVYLKGRDGAAGFDTLIGIERLQFDDQMVLLAAAVLSSDAQLSLDEDAAITLQLAAPSDVERSAVSYRLAAAPAHGTATLSGQGVMSYVPQHDYYGQDVVAFDIVGAGAGAGSGSSNRYLAHITVLPVNDGPPVSRPGAYLAQSGGLLTSQLPAATDVDLDPISYSLVSDATSGTVLVSLNGDFSYQAKAGFSGADSFRFSVSDGMGGSNTYTAKVTSAVFSQTLMGTAGADQLGAAMSGDGYLLLAGDDSVTGGAGDDVFDGGDGIDTAIYSGPRASYRVNNTGAFWVVTDSRGTDGSDKMVNMERLQFADRQVALDMDGHGGQTAQILRALFGPAALKTAEYAGYGVVLLDRGMSFADLVSLAIGSDAFLGLAHSRSNTDFVKLVYKNVTGIAAPVTDLSYYVGLLDSGAYTQASLAVIACQTALNTASVDLVGLASSGLDYIVPIGI